MFVVGLLLCTHLASKDGAKRGKLFSNVKSNNKLRVRLMRAANKHVGRRGNTIFAPEIKIRWTIFTEVLLPE